jgi:hypothetical protein
LDLFPFLLFQEKIIVEETEKLDAKICDYGEIMVFVRVLVEEVELHNCFHFFFLYVYFYFLQS